jgi:phospholipid/cholesterol/gamma-HCH transport system permease protein
MYFSTASVAIRQIGLDPRWGSRPMNRDETKSIFLMSDLRRFLEQVAEFALFSFKYLAAVFNPPYELSEALNQSYLVGCKSLPLVAITSFIMGLVLTIQSRPTLATFGAESWLPAMVSISIIREIGPVITALICAGKIGSGMGAEISSMKVTEQIDAMEVSGINPFKYIVVTRVLATTLMVPLLVILGDAVSIVGVFVAVSVTSHVTLPLFLSEVFEKLLFPDLLSAVIKTFFFGFAIGVVGCFQGWRAENGTQGVGKAANSAVVLASLLIFIIDGIAVQISSVLGR